MTTAIYIGIQEQQLVPSHEPYSVFPYSPLQLFANFTLLDSKSTPMFSTIDHHRCMIRGRPQTTASSAFPLLVKPGQHYSTMTTVRFELSRLGLEPVYHDQVVHALEHKVNLYTNSNFYQAALARVTLQVNITRDKLGPMQYCSFPLRHDIPGVPPSVSADTLAAEAIRSLDRVKLGEQETLEGTVTCAICLEDIIDQKNDDSHEAVRLPCKHFSMKVVCSAGSRRVACVLFVFDPYIIGTD